MVLHGPHEGQVDRQALSVACIPTGDERDVVRAVVHVKPPYGSSLTCTPAPRMAGFPSISPFHGRELPLHINTTWGTFDIVDATKALLRAALLDPANAKMALLSESCVPLYPPTVVYQQLISEPRSRVNACPSKVLQGLGVFGRRISLPEPDIVRAPPRTGMATPAPTVGCSLAPQLISLVYKAAVQHTRVLLLHACPRLDDWRARQCTC